MTVAITGLVHGVLTLVGLCAVGFVGAEWWYDVNGLIQQIGDIDLGELD